MSEEKVLVLETAKLWESGYFQGFSSDECVYLRLMELLNAATFRDRQDVENDPSYKQIIPYVILRNEGAVFSYRRGKLLGEERLLGNYSIGIGGHISTEDLNLFSVTYKAAMQREVFEEVDIASRYEDRVAGLINDDSNDVGKVHLGIVHVFDLEKPLVKPKEKSINEPIFRPLGSLAADLAKYENWSQVCIRNIDEIIHAR